MINSFSPCIRQHDTHETLVGRADSPVPLSSGAPDAIIVPASRPAEHLDHAITLAQAAGCRLVVLCSREARADDVNELLASTSGAEPVVINLPTGYGHQWLKFATSRPQKIGDLPEPCAARESDLSIKRNIGLILARMVGWDRVFFMDDDIENVSVSDLRRTVSMLGRQYYTAGMKVTDFPDNSVVCHAHRATGRFQDVLVGGSVLAVDCTAPIGFFPDVYNEDWLFFYDDAAGGRLAWSGVNATQLRYDPFDQPRRAAGQEFGDVLGEGLYALLHRHQNTTHATQDYWINFLDARRGFLDAIIARAARAPAEVRERMLDSVRAARECSALIPPEFCEHYVRLWRKDLTRWEQTLNEIPRALSIAKALAELGLASATGRARRGHDSSDPAAAVTPKVGGYRTTLTVAEPTPNASAFNACREDGADLARLDALTHTYYMERLQRTLLLADQAAAAGTSHGGKLAAASKVVGVLAMVRMIVAFNRVRLTLSADSCTQPDRRRETRRENTQQPSTMPATLCGCGTPTSHKVARPAHSHRWHVRNPHSAVEPRSQRTSELPGTLPARRLLGYSFRGRS